MILNNDKHNDFNSYLKDLQYYLSNLYSDYEIVIIEYENNNYITLPVKNKILKDISSIRWIQLAFSVNIDIAFNAGIENAIGDFVLLIRPFVDPIEIIEDMINKCMCGNDIVVGISNEPRSFGYKAIRKISNKLLDSIEYNIPKNSTPVRCISRKAINTIIDTGQLKHQFFIKIDKTGYKSTTYEYKLLNSNLMPKKTLFDGITQTLQLTIFNSTKPLRWISILGIIGSLFAFIFAIYSIVVNIFRDDVIEGWTSMVFFSSFLFMILFIILSFIGEYLARLLNEQSQQKSYYISNEATSSIMLEIDRFNVLHQS